MKAENAPNHAKEPFTAYGRYSYKDYLSWQIDETVELIKGKVFKMTAAPKRIHQEIVLKLGAKLYNFLEGKACKAFIAPFDVRLPSHSPKDEDIQTVVQPDICVVCDRDKLDDAGCVGAPDLIVEILSPRNNKKELHHKYEVYEESGVQEYWIIHPDERTLLIHVLGETGYVSSRLFTSGDTVDSRAVEGFQLNLDDLFRDLD